MYIYRIYDTPKRLVDPEEIADQNVVAADNDKISEKEGLDSVKELADVSFSNMELGQDEIFEEEDEILYDISHNFLSLDAGGFVNDFFLTKNEHTYYFKKDENRHGF